MKQRLIKGLIMTLMACSIFTHAEEIKAETIPGRWSIEKAKEWYSKQPWLVGCNYLPANAINQIEMWQKETFDPKTIDKELQMAEDLGFNTLRVYLHDLVWEADQKGFYKRMDKFLDICKKHGMRPMFVFFDDCHHPNPKLGVQPLPVPKYHNSGWVNSPSYDVSIAYAEGKASEKDVARLKGYIQETMRRFKKDKRVLLWELYNEPGRNGRKEKSAKLLRDAWIWAREVAPSQPIASCAEGSASDLNRNLGKANSDVISFHNYGRPEQLEKKIKELLLLDRPLLCTEYMARTRGSTFQNCMPIFKKYNIGCYNWGFVSGKSATIWPRSGRKNIDLKKSRAAGNVVKWGEPFPEPKIWFHDIYRIDGTPFDQKEIDFIKDITGK